MRSRNVEKRSSYFSEAVGACVRASSRPDFTWWEDNGVYVFHKRARITTTTTLLIILSDKRKTTAMMLDEQDRWRKFVEDNISVYPCSELRHTRNGFHFKWLLMHPSRGGMLDIRYDLSNFERQRFCVPTAALPTSNLQGLLMAKKASPLTPDMEEVQETMEIFGRSISVFWHQQVLRSFQLICDGQPLSRYTLFYYVISKHIWYILNTFFPEDSGHDRFVKGRICMGWDETWLNCHAADARPLFYDLVLASLKSVERDIFRFSHSFTIPGYPTMPHFSDTSEAQRWSDLVCDVVWNGNGVITRTAVEFLPRVWDDSDDATNSDVDETERASA